MSTPTTQPTPVDQAQISRAQGSFSVNMSTVSAHPNGAAASNGNGASHTVSPPIASNGNGHAAAAAATVAASPPVPAVASSSHHGGGPSLVNKPSFLEDPKLIGNYRFCIHDCPNDANLPAYVEVLKKKQVVVLARACDPVYNTGPLLGAGIKVVECAFADGDPPPPHVVDRWLALVDQVFKNAGKDVNGVTGVELDLKGVEKPAIALHCVAGLGRAPVLVAIALIESGMEWLDAIAFIRKKRRGAINARQLKYLETYKRRNNTSGGCCTIQ